MQVSILPESQRGQGNYGWLQARYSFSFAEFYDSKRLNFGALKVLNDDQVAQSTGFSTHGHKNMEIITIPLVGGVKHKDSVGNEDIVKRGEIQVMSAGSGVLHSEHNPSSTEVLNLLQIWIEPNKTNVQPRYQKMDIDWNTKNSWNMILTPMGKAEGKYVEIYQDAYFYVASTTKMMNLICEAKLVGSGFYLFVIEGNVALDGKALGRRDAATIRETKKLELTAGPGTELLLMEVPGV